jgi:putative endonuclease
MWFVYILLCSDSTFYIGISPDIEKRIVLHNLGKGAKYTKGRTPVRLIYSEKHENKSVASKREHALKKLSRKEKEQLIAEAG